MLSGIKVLDFQTDKDFVYNSDRMTLPSLDV